jgi:hypothetical protein
LREAPPDESQTCLVQRSHAIAAAFSQRSCGKIAWRAVECATMEMTVSAPLAATIARG